MRLGELMRLIENAGRASGEKNPEVMLLDEDLGGPVPGTVAVDIERVTIEDGKIYLVGAGYNLGDG